MEISDLIIKSITYDNTLLNFYNALLVNCLNLKHLIC